MTGSPHTPSSYSLAIRRPVTVSMVFLTLIVFGWKSYQELPINLMPDISYPTLTVRTEYANAAPEDVEMLITRTLEERLSVVSGVVEISSVSSAGLSEIIMEFVWGTDMNVAMQDVRESLDLFDPPQGVTKKPIILRYDPSLDPVMRIALSAGGAEFEGDSEGAKRRRRDALIAIREAAERQIKSDLEAETGIAQVLVKGGREVEVQIHVDSERIKSLGISLENVVRSLEQHNINLSGGKLKEGKAEYLVRTLNEFRDADEIRGVVVRSPSGQQYRLTDLATVEVGHKDLETIVRINGQEAVALEFYKEGDANTVQVCNKLKDFFGFDRKQGVAERIILYIASRAASDNAQEFLQEIERVRSMGDRLRTRLPEFALAYSISDQSRFIVASIREVQQTAFVGGVLALLILFLFLREVKSTMIIGVAIPISVIATFLPMFLRDVSLNIMSLGGLALGVGMMVDNSIVVLESIFRCREEGDALVEAAERGTREVASAVTASTLTTIAVFFPIVFVEGIAGQLFSDLALTVTFSLFASLFVALYLIPMIASRELAPAQAGRQAIWLTRGYLEARQTDGHGRLGALVRVPIKGVGFARQWLDEAWNDSVGPALEGVRGTGNPSAAGASGGAFARAASALSLPVVAALFLVQMALKLLAVTALTLLGIAVLFLFLVTWVAVRCLKIVLYLPVTFFDQTFRTSRLVYTALLRRTLPLSPLILLAVVGLAVHAGWVATSLGRELIPSFHQGEFGIRIEAPPGTRLEDTEKRAQRIAAFVLRHSDVETVTLVVGAKDQTAGIQEGENVAQLTVQLRNPEETVQIQDEIIEELRRGLPITPSDQVTFTLPTLFSFKSAVEIQIYGDELEQLRILGSEIVGRVHDIRGLKDVELSLKEGYPEIHIELDRDLLATKNLTPFDVAQKLRTEIQGDVATRFSRRGEKVDIRVRSDREHLASLQDLRSLSVSDGHPPTPLSAVARISRVKGPSEIRRIDQRQVVAVTGNIEGRDLGGVIRDIDSRLADIQWPTGYYYIQGGQQRELESSYGGLLFALLLAVFLVYVVMACQFESIWQPALIMFSVPLAFIGVVYVLAWIPESISVVVFIGGIVLAGIVVNDAIVLVDYINQLRARGLGRTQAIVTAGSVRYRPIMMTTLTTVLGLIPMALSRGEGAEIRGPMAITVMAGLSSATILTLVIIPMIYYIFTPKEIGSDESRA